MSPQSKTLAMLAVAAAVGGGYGYSLMTTSASAGAITEERVKEIVKQYINDNPKEIISSLQNWQMREEASRMQDQQAAVENIKNEFKDLQHYGYGGNLKGDVTIVEFFDYNCPACKMMFESIDGLLKEDKNIRVVFVEYPIFGPQSDENAKIGMAVAKLAPEKYFDFHAGMMRHQGKADATYALDVAKNLGVDVEKLKAEYVKPEYNDLIAKDRALGAKLHIQGTPAAIIGNRMVASALSLPDLKIQVQWARTPEKKDEKK